MSGLSAATCMEISVWFVQRLWIFEVHTFNEEGGEEALGAGGGRGGGRSDKGGAGQVRSVVERVWGIAGELGEGG